MQLSQQVCTLEQAIKLKELGVLQDSCFVWGLLNKSLWYIAPQKRPNREIDNTASAYTCSELGVMLPAYITVNDKDYTLHIGKSKDGYFECGYMIFDERLQSDFFVIRNAITEAKAKAKLLLHLLEDNHITAEQVNNSLK